MKAKRLLALLLAICCVTMVGCKKESENGNNSENDSQAPKIVSTKETVLYLDDEGVVFGEYFEGEYLIIVEALFDDDRMMYFAITSPSTAAVVDRQFFYGPDNEDFSFSEGYVYRGDVVVPSELEHLGETYSVTETWSFGGSVFVESVVFPNSLTSVGGCINSSNLKSVTFGNSIVIIDKNSFYNCKRLTSVDFPNTLVEIRETAFYGTDLKAVTIPNSVKKIGYGAFTQNCELKSVTCLAVNPPELYLDDLDNLNHPIYTVLYYRFLSSPETIRVPSQSVQAYKTADGWSQYADIIVGI